MAKTKRMKLSEWTGRLPDHPDKAPIEILNLLRAHVGLHHLEHAPPEARERPLLKTWSEESDRGIVLIWQTMLDDALEVAIASKLMLKLSDKKDWTLFKLLFRGGTAPLRSFWIRARFAYALGLIDITMLKPLDAANEMRRQMAHPQSLRDIDIDAVNRIGSKLPDRLRRKFERTARHLRPFGKEQGLRKFRNPDELFKYISLWKGDECDAKTAALFTWAMLNTPSEGAYLFCAVASFMASEILRKVPKPKRGLIHQALNQRSA